MGSASQYFEPRPAAPSRPRHVVLALPDATMRLQTDRGVFSAGSVDPGTRYLLLEAPPLSSNGCVLDLGCGYGPIALTMARRSPGAVVWAVDVNERALDLCRANAESAGLVNVRCARPEDVPASVRFDAIWSNPPIRVGKAALHSLLAVWLDRLAAGGVATMVVLRNLGADSLARWLADEGWSVDRLGSRAGYRLLAVQRS